MKITLSALINFGSKGADKVAKKTKEIRDNLEAANKDADRLAAIGRQEARANSTYKDKGANKTTHRTLRGISNTRNASGRNFSGIASGLNDGDTNNIVAAYATIAANIFAVTAAFSALQKAAQTEQLTRGLELMGARSGVALKATAQGLREVTDYAISTADAMKVVAQATAAGFKEKEIMRIGAVARGASVALGRDMSDAMDRLTRGTIKLEPELLDELGIMTRLDEAVRVYAKTHNKTASSLTQTERRQAFLNAVLAEGERKFGDVSEQIDSNPYDRLSASIRDMGTSFLTLLNKVLVPVTKILTDMPGLAVGPLMAIFQESASKILPDLGKSFDKLGDRINANIAKSKAVMGEFNEQLGHLEIGGRNALNIFDKADLGSITGGLDRKSLEDLFNPLNKDVAQERQEARERIERNIIELQKSGNAEDLVKIQALQKINRELQLSEEYYTRMNILGTRDSATALNIGLANRQRRRLQELSEYQMRGETFKGLGFALSAAGGDLSVWKDKATSTMEKIKTTSSAASLAARALGSTFLRIIPILGWIVTGAQLIGGAFEMMKSKAQKAIDESKKKLKELGEQAAQTLTQIEKMSAPGKLQLGLAIDAATNSMQNLVAEFENLEKLRARVKNQTRDTDFVTTDMDIYGANNNQVVMAHRLNRAELVKRRLGNDNEIGKPLQEAVNLIKVLNEDEYNKLIDKIKLSGKSQAEYRNMVIDTMERVTLTTARYKNLNEIIQQINTDAADILPKDLETDFTKVAKGWEQINTEIKGGLTNTKAIGESMAGMSVQTLEIQRALAKTFTPDADLVVYDKLIAANKEIADITAKINNAKENGNKLIETMWKAWLDVKVTMLGIYTLAQKMFLIGNTENIEDAKQQLKIDEANLANRQKISQVDLQILKARSEIAKKTREAKLEASKQGVNGLDFDKRAQAAFKLNDARRAYDLTVKENKEKIDTLTEANRIEVAALTQKKNLKESTKKDKEFYQSQIDSANDVLKKEKELARIQNEAAYNEIETAKITLAAYDSKISAQIKANELSKKELENTKTIQGIQAQIRSQTLQQSEEALRFDRYRNSERITPREERNLEVSRLDEELNNIKLERENIVKSYDLQVSGIKLQKEASIAMYNAAIALTSDQTEKDSLITSRDEASKNFDVESATLSTLSQAQLEQLSSTESGIEALKTQLTSLTPLQRAVIELTTASKALREDIDLTVRAGPGMSPQARDLFSKTVKEQGGVEELGPEGIEKIKQATQATESLRIVSEGLNGVFDSMYTGMQGAFEGIITGTKSVKQAFGDMAMSILASIAKMISEMITFRLMSSAMNVIPGFGSMMPMPAPAAAGGVIPLANGGIMDRALSPQGVIKQPTYLVGEGRHNEAVVPLPNGRSIPVQMHGGSSNNNNVQVNVNVSSNGNVQTETQGQDFNNLGTMIANAVQKELLAQKMPGGILNKYGAS